MMMRRSESQIFSSTTGYTEKVSPAKKRKRQKTGGGEEGKKQEETITVLFCNRGLKSKLQSINEIMESCKPICHF